MLSQRLALQILLAAQGRDGMEQAAQATLSLFADSQAQLPPSVGREFAVVASTLSTISTEVDTLAKKGLALASR